MGKRHKKARVERDDSPARMAARLEGATEDVSHFRVLALLGAGATGLAGFIGWYTYRTLRAGYMNPGEGSDIVYASTEPVFFYGSIVFFAAMGAFCAKLGVEMLVHGLSNSVHAAHRRKRLARAIDEGLVGYEGDGGRGGRTDR